MREKPIIQNLNQLTVYATRYRDMLCARDPGLEGRLRNGAMQRESCFSELASRFDAILFDAYGVLNRGEAVIPGAPETLRFLRDQSKPFLVVSNNASQAPTRLESRFQQLGFDITASDIVTSGMAVSRYVEGSRLQGLPYYLVGTSESREAYAPQPTTLMVNEDWQKAEYVILCGNRDYYGGQQETHVEALLTTRPVPLLVVNPDLVAPQADGGVSAVVGFTAAQLAERFQVSFLGLGKPFPTVFELAMEKLPDTTPERILMVGDTLDTDILGGAMMGFTTCLALSGVYADQPDSVDTLCAARGIYPDFVVESLNG